MLTPPAFLIRLPILRRLVPSLLRRYARIFKHRYSIERRMGALFLIDQRKSVDRNLMIRGAWEPAQFEELGRLLARERREGEKAIFLDIGAHGALYSIVMNQTGAFDRIVAFEPEPTNLAQLRANLFINGLLDRIEVIETAAWSHRGKIPFFISDESNRGASRMSTDNSDGLIGRIEVNAAPVDELVDFSGGLVVAKIDVEGCELTTLAGMTRTIANNRCLFQIESFESKFPDLREWLVARGFSHVSTRDFDHYFLKA